MLICLRSGVGSFYFLTLAPEVTLEDSGELMHGAFYAGIPSSARLSVLDALLVALDELAAVRQCRLAGGSGGSSAADAMACATGGFMMSRGSSMFIEGIEELKGLAAEMGERDLHGVRGGTAGSC